MNRMRFLKVAVATLVPLAMMAVASGCNKKDDEDKPVATVAPPPPPPPPAPTPIAPAVIAPEEDAGVPVIDAGVVKPATGPGSASGSIARCCAALSQNANSAPPDQKGAYMAAAATCNGLRNTPVANQAFAQIRAFLIGAKMPSACQ